MKAYKCDICSSLFPSDQKINWIEIDRHKICVDFVLFPRAHVGEVCPKCACALFQKAIEQITNKYIITA